jgi:hypothetical protein
MTNAESLATTITLTPAFKLIFICVTALTIIFLAMSVTLICAVDQTDGKKSLTEKCSSAWQMGFGAIVGLIGGKAA